MDMSFDQGKGLPGHVLESREPAWIIDLQEDNNFPRTKLKVDIGLRSGFGLPILAGDWIEGALEFFSESNNEPGQSLFNVLLQIGIQICRIFKRCEAAEKLYQSWKHYSSIIHTAMDGF